MSNLFPLSEPGPRRGAALAGLLLAAAAAAALAGCSRDNGAGNPDESGAPPSAAPSAASAGAPSAAALAAACPKLEAPRCPTTAVGAQAGSPAQRTARMAAAWSEPPRPRHARHRHASPIALERRRWDQGRPWPGDRPDGDQSGFRGARQDLMGGPPVAGSDRRMERSEAFGWRGGYRLEEGSRETERMDSWRVHRDGVAPGRGGILGCPIRCMPVLGMDPGRDYRAAGIDASGYLIWPGKVEY